MLNFVANESIGKSKLKAVEKISALWLRSFVKFLVLILLSSSHTNTQLIESWKYCSQYMRAEEGSWENVHRRLVTTETWLAKKKADGNLKTKWVKTAHVAELKRLSSSLTSEKKVDIKLTVWEFLYTMCVHTDSLQFVFHRELCWGRAGESRVSCLRTHASDSDQRTHMRSEPTQHCTCSNAQVQLFDKSKKALETQTVR